MSAMTYKQGSFDAQQFEDVFGLKSVDEGKAYSEGSTTGTKQTGALGTYMTKKDYNRLKNDDKVWDAYASVHGEEAAAAKREKGAMSINTLDSLMDDLSADAETKAEAPTPVKKPDFVEASPEIVEAKQRVKAYEEEMRGDRFDVYAQRSNERFDPNQGFQAQ